MDFAHSERSLELQHTAQQFLEDRVLPAEHEFELQAAAARAAGTPFRTPPILQELKAEARALGLWNLFLPDTEHGAGLSVLDYAPIAEISGRSLYLLPEAMNCSAPDTGNMELLHMFATPEQREQWLLPLLEGEIRSCFSMTEPAVASSDATNISLRITRDGSDYVIKGRKWWSTGVMRPECRFAIVMGVSEPDAPAHQRHTMIIVPIDTPGVTVHRSTTVFGYDDGPHGGHGEISFNDVRVPATNVLGEPGAGFALAQARLGPGRIHHCMRSIGVAERALALMAKRVSSRSTFGSRIADHGVIQEWIAESRMAIEQARLMTLYTAWKIDTQGAKAARNEISIIKIAVPRAASLVVDKAIQAFGAAGVSQDTPLAEMFASLRTMRIVDGPDEVHLRGIAKAELRR